MIFVSGERIFPEDMNFGNIAVEIVHYARRFSCKIARFNLTNTPSPLLNFINGLILKQLFKLASNLLNILSSMYV